MQADVAYTEVGGSDVAYLRLDGAADRELVYMAAGALSFEDLDGDPNSARLLDGLRAIGSVTCFDRRGVGLSGPLPAEPSPGDDWWLADLLAVAEDAGLDRPTLICAAGAGTIGVVASAEYDLPGALVLFNPLNPWAVSEDTRGQFGAMMESNRRGDFEMVKVLAPSRADDPAFRSWWDDAGRRAAGPAGHRRLYRDPLGSPDWDERTRTAYERLSVPTLLLRRPEAMSFWPADELARLDARMAVSRRVEVPGEDLLIYGSHLDELLAEISRFLTGDVVLPPPARSLAAVLFTDLGRSTELASAVGDASWRETVAWHDARCTELVERQGGAVVKTTGDGVLAIFSSATAAVASARGIRVSLAEQDLTVRAGIHVGDIERHGGDVSGVAVNLAARVMAEADPGELLITASAHRAMLGAGIEAESLGDKELRGIPGRWELRRVMG